MSPVHDGGVSLGTGIMCAVVIAAAVMEEPDIVILDEPINALDESGAMQVRDILKKQKDRGAVCIIACHDTEELEYLSDVIIEIKDGAIV